MKYKYLVLVLCFFVTAFLAGEFVNAQSGGWKLVQKNSWGAEYIGDVKVDNSGEHSSPKVNYKYLTNYYAPKKTNATKEPFQKMLKEGWINCLDGRYSSRVLKYMDKKGNPVQTRHSGNIHKERKIEKNSIEEKVFNQYCDMSKVAAARKTRDAKNAPLNRAMQEKSQAQKAEFASLKKKYQPLVNEYGDITSVEKCNPRSQLYRDCDYQIHTSFKVVGGTGGAIVGPAPVFFKGNDIFVKNGAIVKVIGVGKSKDYFEKKYKNAKKNK